MKHLKKLLTALLCAALLLTLCSSLAFATSTPPTYTFVVKNDTDSGYTYLLYQMLTGDIATMEGKQVFSNVAWGDGVKDTSKETMYDMANLTGADRTAAKFAEWLGKQDEAVFHQMMAQVGVHDGSSLQNPTTLTYGSYSIDGNTVNGYGKTGLAGGYYLVRNTAVPTGQTYSDYIVFVLDKDTAADPKSAPSPTPEKQVTDRNDSDPVTSGINATGNTTGNTEPDVTTVFTFKLVFNKVDGDKNPLTGADFVLYKWVTDDAGANGTWVDVTTMGTSTDKPTKEKSASGTVTDCIFTFSGLDDGRYKLHESATPTGYNTIADIEFEVTASHDKTSAAPQLIGLSGFNSAISFTMTPNVNDGSLSADIINENGTVLPTTGAGGTMLLVSLGTLAAVIGIVVLVTRRRLLAE